MALCGLAEQRGLSGLAPAGRLREQRGWLAAAAEAESAVLESPERQRCAGGKTCLPLPALP